MKRLEVSKSEEINALTDTQRELERRLADKTSHCRRVEEEAAALRDKLLQSADSRAQWLTKKVASLEKEVESLNAVLEIKVPISTVAYHMFSSLCHRFHSSMNYSY